MARLERIACFWSLPEAVRVRAAVKVSRRGICSGLGGPWPLPDDVGQREHRRAVGVVRPGFGLGHGRLACPSATAARTIQ